jgi:hypothetical protein
MRMTLSTAGPSVMSSSAPGMATQSFPSTALLAANIPNAIEELESGGHLGSIDPDHIARQYRWLAGR